MTVVTEPAPVYFEAPLVNPSPNGLYAATTWADQGEPLRWLTAGVTIRPHNYGGETASGVWHGTWCAPPADPDEKKTGVRPNMLPDAFTPIVVWAEDDCDPSQASQTEILQRAQQNLRLLEQIDVEADFSTRLLADAGSATTVNSIVAAVSRLEAEIGNTNTVGVIHASTEWAAYAAQAQLIVRNGNVLRTPLGHLWVFGGGYRTGLGDTLVATSPTFGWRGDPTVRSAIDFETGEFHAVAERALVVGYEKAIHAVQITP